MGEGVSSLPEPSLRQGRPASRLGRYGLVYISTQPRSAPAKPPRQQKNGTHTRRSPPRYPPEGELEARVAGQLLLAQGFEFDIVYTSMLKRAIKTAWVVLDELNQQHVPVTTDWHLNERCYGALVGREKKECVRVFGKEQVWCVRVCARACFVCGNI